MAVLRNLGNQGSTTRRRADTTIEFEMPRSCITSLPTFVKNNSNTNKQLSSEIIVQRQSTSALLAPSCGAMETSTGSELLPETAWFGTGCLWQPFDQPQCSKRRLLVVVLIFLDSRLVSTITSVSIILLLLVCLTWV